MWKKLFFALLIIVAVVVLIQGCAKAEEEPKPTLAPSPTSVPPTSVPPTKIPTPTPTPEIREKVLVDEEFDSEELEGWKSDFDANLCPGIPHQDSQKDARIIEVSGNNMLLVSVNEVGEPGMHGNHILSNTQERCDKCTIVAGVWVGVPPKKPLTEQEKEAGAPETEEELVNISLEVCDAGVCRYGEFLYYLNRWNTKEEYPDNPYHYEDVFIRYVYTDREKDPEIKVVTNLDDDREFHYLEIQASIDVENDYYFIDHFKVDDQEFSANWAMWPEKKAEGYEDVMQFFLETHNASTGCQTDRNFKAYAFWDKVSIIQYPFGQGPYSDKLSNN
jgi:hypothetical protein